MGGDDIYSTFAKYCKAKLVKSRKSATRAYWFDGIRLVDGIEGTNDSALTSDLGGSCRLLIMLAIAKLTEKTLRKSRRVMVALTQFQNCIHFIMLNATERYNPVSGNAQQLLAIARQLPRQTEPISTPRVSATECCQMVDDAMMSGYDGAFFSVKSI
jgi:hypothetical protein